MPNLPDSVFYTEDQFNQNLWRMLNELHDKYVGELAEPWLSKRENKFSKILWDFTNALNPAPVYECSLCPWTITRPMSVYSQMEIKAHLLVTHKCTG
jgi:hypothetical protein